jgi:hypothetical protein
MRELAIASLAHATISVVRDMIDRLRDICSFAFAAVDRRSLSMFAIIASIRTTERCCGPKASAHGTEARARWHPAPP